MNFADFTAPRQPLILAALPRMVAADQPLSGRLFGQAVLVLAGTLLLAVSAHIKVPFWPVPQTMQTFAVLLIAMSYGSRLGTLTIGAYLVEGMLGLPVFAAGSGLAYMAGPTAGYLVGFLVAGGLLGWLADQGWCRSWQSTVAAMLIGNAVIYLFGLGWLTQLFGAQVAISAGLLPFIWGDLAKIVLAALAMPAGWYLASRLGRKG